MGVATMDVEKCDNSLRECSKVVYIPDKNRYDVVVTAKWTKKYVSCKIGSIFDSFL